MARVVQGIEFPDDATDEEISDFIASEVGSSAARASSYGPSGVPLGPTGQALPYQGSMGGPNIEKPNPFMDPLEYIGAFAPGPRSFFGAGARLAESVAARAAAKAGATAAPEAGSAAGRVATVLAKHGAEHIPIVGNVLRAKRLASELSSALGAGAKEAEKEVTSAVGRLAKEAQRQFGKGTTVTEGAGRYVIRDAGGLKIGSGDTFKEAIDSAHASLGTVRKAIRTAVEKPMGRVVGEIKPAARAVEKAVGAAESRVAGVFKAAGEASKPELQRRAYSQVVATGRLLKGQELTEELMKKALAERAAKVRIR